MTPSPSQPNDRLRQERLLRGWSQKDVADRIGANYYYLSRWERGTTMPGPYYRQKLCALFGKNASELGLLTDAEKGAQDTLGMPAEPSPAASEQIFDPSTPLPATGNIRLIGRDALLATLKERLCGEQLPINLALYGLPGVGKTMVAASLAHDPTIQARFRDGVLWTGLGTRPELTSILSRWGTLLGVSPPSISNRETWVSTLRAAIGKRRLLFIIDDVWQLEDFLACKVGGANCAYIVTTRFPQIAMQSANYEAIALEELNEDDSIALLTQMVPYLASAELAELAQAVGGLPLALVLIGRYLLTRTHDRQPRRIRSAIGQLRNAEARLHLSLPQALLGHTPTLPAESPVSLQTVIAMSDQQLDEQCQAALHALSVFPPKPNTFSEEAACSIAQTEAAILDRLSDAGLLESREPGRYTLHQTIADYARGTLTTTQPYQRMVTYFTEYLESHKEHYQAIEQEIANILSALEMAFQYDQQSALVRSVWACHPFLDARGLYELAELHLGRAERICRTTQDIDTLISILHSSGQIALQRGNAARAEHCYVEGLRLVPQSTDQSNMRAMLTTALFGLFTRLGKYKQAQDLIQETLSLAQQSDDRGLIIYVLVQLGAIANEQGNFVQGEAYLLEALERIRASGLRTYLYHTLNNLSSSTAEQGKCEQAESYLREAVDLARQQGHREKLCATLSNLGAVYSRRQRYEQATPALKEALAVAQELKHREWISIITSNLGEIARSEGRLDESLALQQEALLLARELDMRWAISSILLELGETYLAQQETEHARRAFAEVRDWASSEQSQALLADSLYALARVETSQGKIQEATSLGQASLATYEACNHHKSAEVRQWLATLSTRQ